MGSSTKTKSQTTVAPPSWGQPYVTGALGAEQSGYNQAANTYKQFNPDQTGAINYAYDNMNNPSAFTSDAQGLLDQTINGKYLEPGTNPFEAAMGKQIGDQTQGEYNTTFGGSGRDHGGLASVLSSQGVGNALDNFYGNIYEQERSRQQQAMMAEPAFHADQFTAPNAMMPYINSTAMGPLQAAALYGTSVGGTVGQYGTTNTNTTQTQPFGLSSMLGLGMMGMSAIPGLGGAVGSALGIPSGMGAYGASPFGMAGLMAPTVSNPNGNMIYGAGTGWGG